MPGTRLGRNFVIEQEIATGGSAWVYSAHHKTTQQAVAVKLFKEASDQKRIEAFKKEGRRHYALEHPNITRLIWMDQHVQHLTEGRGLKRNEHTIVRPFVVMERAADSMGALMRSAVLPVDTAIQYITDAAKGLQYAHEVHGLVHRDIKPDNILVTHQGHSQITDFGISVRLPDIVTESETIASQNIAGTWPYTPPEQFVTNTELRPSTDVYALGATFYEALNDNKRPFYIPGGNGMDYYHMHSNVEADPIKRMDEHGIDRVADALQGPIFKALAKNPQDRYQTMAEFADAIHAAAAKGHERKVTSYVLGAPLSPAHLPLYEKTIPQPDPGELARVPVPPPKEISRRKVLGICTASVAAAAAVGVGGYETFMTLFPQQNPNNLERKEALSQIAARFVLEAPKCFGTGHGFELARSLLAFNIDDAFTVATAYDKVFDSTDMALATQLASRLVTAAPDRARKVMLEWSGKQKLRQAIMVAAGFAANGDSAPAEELLRVANIRSAITEFELLTTILANKKPDKALEAYTKTETHWAVASLSRAYADRYGELFRQSADAYRRKTADGFTGLAPRDAYASQLLDLSPKQPDFLEAQMGYASANVPVHTIAMELAARKPDTLVTYIGTDRPDDPYRRVLGAALGQRRAAFVRTLLAQRMPIYSPDATHQAVTQPYNPPFAITSAWLKVSRDPTHTKDVEAAFQEILDKKNADHLGNYGGIIMAALLRS